MSKDFTHNLNNNFKQDTENKTDTLNDGSVFILKHKTSDKIDKRAFNVSMTDELIKELDKVGKKTGYSRNELISIMCEFCVKNIKIE